MMEIKILTLHQHQPPSLVDAWHSSRKDCRFHTRRRNLDNLGIGLAARMPH